MSGRYSEFRALHVELAQRLPSYARLPPLPKRRLRFWTNHLDPIFIESRRRKLSECVRHK